MAIKNHTNKNIIKLFINKETDINQKYYSNNNDRNFNFLEILFKNYIKEYISEILNFFNDKEKILNAFKLNINDSNKNMILEYIPKELIEDDIFGWNLLNYLFWNKRGWKISYLLIFNY